jgi:Arc/MetJ-type ribon-helix-helix transcriptional regulator
MAGNMIQFRADTDLSADLDEFIETLQAEGGRVTRSSACRQLLRAALGTPRLQAAARESMMSTLAIQKRALARINELVQEELPALLEAEGGT